MGPPLPGPPVSQKVNIKTGIFLFIFSLYHWKKGCWTEMTMKHYEKLTKIKLCNKNWPIQEYIEKLQDSSGFVYNIFSLEWSTSWSRRPAY
jgi:hypothetical protein